MRIACDNQKKINADKNGASYFDLLKLIADVLLPGDELAPIVARPAGGVVPAGAGGGGGGAALARPRLQRCAPVGGGQDGAEAERHRLLGDGPRRTAVDTHNLLLDAQHRTLL